MQSSIRELIPALLAATAMVVGGAVLGLLVASHQSGPLTAVATSSSQLATIPTASRTPAPMRPPSPTPSPSRSASALPSPTETLVPTADFPTPLPGGQDGLPGALPFLAIDGADADVVNAIRVAVDRIGDLHSYRYTAGTGGRSILNFASVDGVYLGARGSVTQAKVRSVDLLVAVQTVEFNGGAGISSTDHVVLIGDRGWALRTGQKPQPYPVDARSLAIVELVLPTGFAERAVLPFAGGYELVGPERHGELAAIHYRATETGKVAYARATGVEGAWSVDLWVATKTRALIGVEIKGQGAGQDGFQVTIELTDVNDPGIVIKVPR